MASNIQQLRLPEEFTYQFFIENRYKISQNRNYQALCNNGFIKLYTPNGRIYWHAQNQFSHLTPDWKFHISVKHQHLMKAWNLIARLFVTMKCRSGMKTYYLKECVNPEPGRQITVYILKYDDQFKKSSFANDFQLSRADQHSEQFWYQFVKNVQKILQSHQIQSNGLANGDLKIGKYVSLRNEAFVLNQLGQHIYPPNNCGWNPLNYLIPLNLKKMNQFMNKKQEQEQEDQQQSILSKTKGTLISFAIPIALAAFGFYQANKKN